MGFSRTTISRVYREWSEKEKISSKRQLCRWKCLLDVRGQRRIGRLVRDDRKATVTQITTRYNHCMQNTISERTTCWTLKADGLQQQKTTPGAWKHGSILPCLNGSGWWWWWCNDVGFIYLAHFGPLSTIEHRLNATAYLSIVADHIHPFMTTVYPSSDATSSRIMHHFTKLKSSQTGFLNMKMSSLYSNGLHSHQISIQ